MLRNVTAFIKVTNTNSTNNFFNPATNAETHVFLCLAGGLCVLGIIFNILTLVAVWPGAREKSSFAWQMCHFLAVQLVMCLINVPVSLIYIHKRLLRLPLSASSCSYIQSIYNGCTAVINWADAGLALNRCIALFFPHKYSVWTRMPFNIFAIVFTWIPSFTGYMVPPLMRGFENITILTRSGYCTWWAAGGHDLGKLPLFLATAIPYVFTGIGATLILGKCYRMTPKLRNIAPASAPRNRTPERRLKRARMLLFMLLWTGACVAPGLVLINFFAHFVATHDTGIIWLRLLAPLQYSATPVILLAFNDEYRSRLVKRFRFVRMVALGMPRRLAGRDGGVSIFSGKISGSIQ